FLCGLRKGPGPMGPGLEPDLQAARREPDEVPQARHLRRLEGQAGRGLEDEEGGSEDLRDADVVGERGSRGPGGPQAVDMAHPPERLHGEREVGRYPGPPPTRKRLRAGTIE